MADKIKILEIKRDSEVKSDAMGKKNFQPLEDVWFSDDDALNPSSFNTDELGTTIDNVAIKDDEIAIVKNANANFFLSPNGKRELKKMVQNVPESINVIENNQASNSELPKEIIELRKSDFLNQQHLKNQILEKLNINLDEAMTKQIKHAENISVKNVVGDLNKMAKDVLAADQTNGATSNAAFSGRDEFKTSEINDKTAVIVPQKQKKAAQKQEPMPYNDDYTMSNTVNDFDKQIIDPNTEKLKSESFVEDNTTILVNNLLNGMNKVNEKRNKNAAGYDEFVNWFKSSNESKKLQKLAKKENKKLLKKKGVKVEK
jgi:hypothetical protein